MKEIVKKPWLLPEIDQVMWYVSAYLEGYYNKQPHSGDNMYGRMPDEVFAAGR